MRDRRSDVVGMTGWGVARTRDGWAGVACRLKTCPHSTDTRIFDPFFITKDPDRGTGLGLAIAFDIVRDHGGRLEVRSKPGAGARFIVRLPHCGARPGPPGRDAA